MAKTLRTSVFSDTVLFSCEVLPDDVAWLLDSVQRLCVDLLEIGCYTRGALTVGDLLHDPRGIVVGRPLIQAHEIERSVAKYPRLIVTDDVAPLMFGARQGEKEERGLPQTAIDVDGLTYLDIFGREKIGARTPEARRAAKKAMRIVQRDLRGTRSPRRHRKYRDQRFALECRAKYELADRLPDARLGRARSIANGASIGGGARPPRYRARRIGDERAVGWRNYRA